MKVLQEVFVIKYISYKKVNVLNRKNNLYFGTKY